MQIYFWMVLLVVVRDRLVRAMFSCGLIVIFKVVDESNRRDYIWVAIYQSHCLIMLLKAARKLIIFLQGN